MPGISPKELATNIRRSRDTVLRWFGQGLIPGVRRNKRVIVFDTEQVKSAMEKHNLKPGS